MLDRRNIIQDLAVRGSRQAAAQRISALAAYEQASDQRRAARILLSSATPVLESIEESSEEEEGSTADEQDEADGNSALPPPRTVEDLRQRKRARVTFAPAMVHFEHTEEDTELEQPDQTDQIDFEAEDHFDNKSAACPPFTEGLAVPAPLLRSVASGSSAFSLVATGSSSALLPPRASESESLDMSPLPLLPLPPILPLVPTSAAVSLTVLYCPEIDEDPVPAAPVLMNSSSTESSFEALPSHESLETPKQVTVETLSEAEEIVAEAEETVAEAEETVAEAAGTVAEAEEAVVEPVVKKRRRKAKDPASIAPPAAVPREVLSSKRGVKVGCQTHTVKNDYCRRCALTA